METRLNDGAVSAEAAPAPVREKNGVYDKFFKRFFDFVLSLAGLIALCPLYLILSAIIYIDDPGAVIFKQKRIGRYGKPFYMHKFRSMRLDAPADVPTHMMASPEKYMTRTGKFIRLTSLDELPQIWDIFIGNMSIVGPRPALWNQCDLIAERDRYGANSVRPGLTGWAQINGRDKLDISEKARYDGEYVQRESLLFDIKCFFLTIASVLKHDGVVEGIEKQDDDLHLNVNNIQGIVFEYENLCSFLPYPFAFLVQA